MFSDCSIFFYKWDSKPLWKHVFITKYISNLIFIIPLVFHVFIKKNCFYQVIIKSQMARFHLYRQWFYKCYNFKSYKYLNMMLKFKTQNRQKIYQTQKDKKYFPIIIGKKCRLRYTCTENNNDHTQIMCKMQFCSSFKGCVTTFLLVCFLSLNESTCGTRNFFISLFSFLRK